MLVLDTNIVIYYLQGLEDISNWVEHHLAKGQRFAISAMSLVELLSYPSISPEEIFHIEQWVRAVCVVDVDPDIARCAALLRRRRRLTTTDAVIGATALALGVPLVTRDVRLSKIGHVKVIVP